jgi:hypothetical protein
MKIFFPNNATPYNKEEVPIIQIIQRGAFLHIECPSKET